MGRQRIFVFNSQIGPHYSRHRIHPADQIGLLFPRTRYVALGYLGRDVRDKQLNFV
jgi:hypothetical protein